ncbi:hypothetical protein MMC25_001524 [Agyrium rufum]|nr:hypothetical protein [Agyrium rufum]
MDSLHLDVESLLSSHGRASEIVEKNAKEEGVAAHRQGSASARSLHGVKWVIAVTAVLSTTMLFSLDNTIVADVQPSIIDSVGEVSKLSWLGTAYALGSAASILPWSRLYGVADVKWLYLAHILTFETGSTLCGAAPNMDVLIVGRAIAGLGASGMYVGCLTYLSLMTTVRERPIYMGLVGLVWGLGSILGPVIGGAFVDSNATWRWGGSAIDAAVHLLAFIVMVVVFSMLNGALLAKLGYYMPWYIFGGASVLTGASLFFSVNSSTTPAAIYGYSVLIGAGVGSFLQAGFAITQALVDPEDIPSAVGFMTLGQSFGIVVSLAIAGMIYQTQALSNLQQVLPGVSEATARETRTGMNSAYIATLSPQVRRLVIEGIVKAMDRVYLLVLISGALTILIAIFLPRKKLFVDGSAAEG